MNSSGQARIIDDLQRALTQNAHRYGANLVILCGLPYSGKSTIAQQLEKYGFIHIWTTVIKKQFSLNDLEALHVIELLAERLLRDNYRVTIDFLNHTDDQRRIFIDIATRLHIPYKIVFVNTPLETIQARKAQSDLSSTDQIGRSRIDIVIVHKIADELTIPHSKNTIEITPSDQSQYCAYLKTLQI